LNGIIIYIFIYEHFFPANNKLYKLICVIWAIICLTSIILQGSIIYKF
jgi:hypothetical protein